MKLRINKMLELLTPVALIDYLYKISSYLINFSDQQRNAQFKYKGAPDDLSIPPLHLIYLVTGYFDIERYYCSGIAASEYIKNALNKNGVDINDLESILDFGCGCGRVIRNWKKLKKTQLYGVDKNPLLILWCKKTLDFAEFKINKLSSRLDYNDNKFDFIYAISVFTHFSEKLQNFYIKELKRVLKPGGILLITMRTSLCELHKITSDEKERFELGDIVVKHEKYAGTNVCNTFHPEKYIREVLEKEFRILDFISNGAKDFKQDVFVLKKE